MAPAARHEETNPIVAPTSESDRVGAQGTGRKYAGAIALLALVAVIVGGVGMHRHAVQSVDRDAEIGDIIEACADYTVQASCSAASCNWNSATVQCEELVHRKKKASFLSTLSTNYVAAAEREDQDNSTAAPAPAVGNTNNNGVITCTLTADAAAGSTVLTLADVTGLEVGMYITIDGVSYKIISITFSRRLSEDGRRLATPGTVGVSPALANAVTTGSTITAQTASSYDAAWWAAHGHKYPGFPAATSSFGGHESACHQEFSAATSGKTEAEIQTVCGSYKAGAVGSCTTTDGTGWITTWCASRG